MHKTKGPAALQKTRPAYKLFDPDVFKFRIYQKVRRTMFLNYLAMKREEERLAPKK